MQVGLRLCCSQTPEGRFSHVEAHLYPRYVKVSNIFDSSFSNKTFVIWFVIHKTLDRIENREDADKNLIWLSPVCLILSVGNYIYTVVFEFLEHLTI